MNYNIVNFQSSILNSPYLQMIAQSEAQFKSIEMHVRVILIKCATNIRKSGDIDAEILI